MARYVGREWRFPVSRIIDRFLSWGRMDCLVQVSSFLSWRLPISTFAYFIIVKTQVKITCFGLYDKAPIFCLVRVLSSGHFILSPIVFSLCPGLRLFCISDDIEWKRVTSSL